MDPKVPRAIHAGLRAAQDFGFEPLAKFASSITKERSLMRKYPNAWHVIRSHGQDVVKKAGLVVLLTLLAVTLVLNMTTPSQAHAASSVRTYTIVSGDTLSEIAQRYGVSVSALVAANHITDPNLIYAGNVLYIPDGESVSTPGAHPSQQLSGSYADMIHQVFGVYGDGAVQVAMCESSLNPRAYNGVLGAAGLFQIIPGTFASTSYRGQSVYDPVANIEAAHEIFARDGNSWSEWACKP